MAGTAGKAGKWAALRWRIRYTWDTLRETRRRRIISTTIMVLIVVAGAIRLWTWWPDTVHITVIQRDNLGHTRMVYDRTIHNMALAQRLQRDADAFALPDLNPLATTTCLPAVTTYIIQWSRFGLPTEQVSDATDNGVNGCTNLWLEDGFIPRQPSYRTVIYADMAQAGVPKPLSLDQLTQPTP